MTAMNLPTCSLDRNCCAESEALALDTSYVCVLSRAALEVANQDSLGTVFRQLLTIHNCGGEVRLVTSRTLCATELNLANPDAPPRRFAALPPDSLDELLECLDDEDVSELPDPPEGVGQRDLTLLAAVAQLTDEGLVTLVSDDERLIVWCQELLVQMPDANVGVWPRYSIDYLGALHECGALTFDTLLVIVEREEEYAYEQWTGSLRQRKLKRIRDVYLKAGYREAQRQ
jgi:hypothetical protein